ncbi:MAG: hypothetical protein LUC41_01010 [Clostridiales bacterium]|nr:hypothetical protein [Clostridiales bacterium]
MDISIRDRVAASRVRVARLAGEFGREVVLMTAYEIVMVILGILGLLVAFGGLLVALLNFFDKRDSRRK